ncbi:MAG: hypothetical protein J5999_00795 [Oscillospiraceae bacterium]|nr:hypothetical protein [Oscillospiraceae bacterium]
MIKRAALIISLHMSIQKPWERILWYIAAAALFIFWTFTKLSAYTDGVFTSQFFSVFMPIIIYEFFYHNESVMMKSSPNSLLSQVYLPPVLCSAFLIFDAVLTHILMTQTRTPDSLMLIFYSTLAAAEMVILPAALRKFRYALPAAVMIWLACSMFSKYDAAIAVPFAGIISTAVIIVGCFASICISKRFFGYELHFANNI